MYNFNPNMRWLALLVLFIASSVLAQTHVPLFNEPTRIWTSTYSGTVDAYCSDTWTTSFWLSGDSIINDTTYQRVASRGIYFQGYINAPQYACTTSYFFDGVHRFVREFDRKVYARYGSTPERLIYDFTVEVGDTIPIPSNMDGFQYQGVVTTIDSIEVNGTYRKRFIIPEIPGYGTGVACVIEGIGGCRGLFQELYGQMGLSHFTLLDCVMEQGSSIYGEDECNLYTTVAGGLSTRSIIVAPNPSPGHFYISGMAQRSVLEIFDAQGRLIMRPNGDLIDLSGKPSGLYLLRIRTPQGQPISSHWLAVQR